MANIYLFFGDRNHARLADKLAERDSRKLAGEKGEGTVELFDLSSADTEQLRQFSYLIDPQDRMFFIDDEKSEEVLESYLDSVEETMDPEKILAVLSLSGKNEVPFRFMQAIHRLYHNHESAREENSLADGMDAHIGDIHYQPSPKAYNIFGFGNIEKTDIETYHDIPASFEDAGIFLQNPDLDNFSAEILNFPEQ